MKRYISPVLLIVWSLLLGSVVHGAQPLNFEPVRAPSKGPEDAPVTVVEIADFM